jgi:two-component system LytT family response regulator
MTASMGESPKIRVLIVDDERLARSNLAVLLRRNPEIEIIAECGSGHEAIAVIRMQKPELLFLDVQMPECDGFDVLEALGQSMPPAVVFVTAYDEYAIRAFEAGALDYLLKPFDDARFARTLVRAKERLAQYNTAPRGTGRVAIKDRGQILFLNIAQIDWIEAADYYACLHVGQKSYLLRRSMVELEQELDANIFCRVHRSAIVNLERVESLELNQDGESEVALKNGARLPLSRRHRKQVQARLIVSQSSR